MTDDSKITGDVNLDSGKSSNSLGFLTWQRHTNATLAGKTPIMRRRQNGLLSIHGRHSSFATGLIARRFNQAAFQTEASGFVFRSGQYERQRGMSGAYGSDTHPLLAKRLLPLAKTVSTPAEESVAANPLRTEPVGEVRDIPVLSRKATVVAESSLSSLTRSIVPKDILGSHSPIRRDNSTAKSATGTSTNQAAGEEYFPLADAARNTPHQRISKRLAAAPFDQNQYSTALLRKVTIGKESPLSPLRQSIIAPYAPRWGSPIRATGDLRESGARSAISKGIGLPLIGTKHSIIHRSRPISMVPLPDNEPLTTRSSKHIARKTSFFDSSQRYASNTAINTLYRATHPETGVKVRQSGIQESLPIQLVESSIASGKPTRRSDGFLPAMLARRPVIAMSYHPTDLQTRWHSPLTQTPLTLGSIPVARQLQRSGSGRMEDQPLYAYRRPVGLPAVSEAIIRRKTANVNLWESKSEMKSAPWQTPADGSTDESQSSPAVELESSGASEPGVSTTIIPTPSATSVPGLLRGSKILSRQHSRVPNQSLLRSVPLHLTASSGLMRSALPVSHSLPGTSQDFPRFHVLPPQPALQRKQTHGVKLPQMHDKPLISPETFVQRAAEIGNDPASTVATKSIPQPASSTIVRADVETRISRLSMSEGAVPGRYALGAVRNQDVSMNFPVARQANPSGADMIMTNKHYMESSAPHILRRVDRSPLSDNPPTNSISSSIGQMASLHHPKLIPAGSRLISTSPADLQASGIARATAERVMRVSYPLNTISRFSLNAPVFLRTAVQRLPGNRHTVPLSLPYAISRRINGGTTATARPAGIERLGITNASASGRTEAHAFSDPSGVASSQRTSLWHSNQAAGVAERPLVAVQRVPSKLMDAPHETPNVMRNPDRPEDRYGVVSPANEVSGETRVVPGGAPSTAAAAQQVSDPEEIAEQAWRMIAERLVIEQERRGLTKWM